MDNTQAVAAAQGKNPIEALSKEEIINKYKGLLGIAKKAKQAKDELLEENRKLKETLTRHETQAEADKNALFTMQELIEEFTQNKLELANSLSEAQLKKRADEEALQQLGNENESLRRQLSRLNEDNESLLADIDRMEQQLKQVNLLGLEQKQHLALLELEVNKLQSAESQLDVENKTLQQHAAADNKLLNELREKYNSLKESSSAQRHKFNTLKERFVDVYRKLKQLQQCKRILLETQHEYAEAVSTWQQEIIVASQQLCAQLNALHKQNQELQEKLAKQSQTTTTTTTVASIESSLVETFLLKLRDLQLLVAKAAAEQSQQKSLLQAAHQQNAGLEQRLLELSEKQQQLSEAETVDANSAVVDALQEQLQQQKTRYADKEREHAELLGEMRELNEALKTRGDVISKQRGSQQELEEAVQQLEAQLNAKNAAFNELQQSCSQNEQQMQQLSAELQQLRQHEAAADAQSEILSTSTTLSRAEELSRLREVDDSFEEKYNKLRALAVKLKKKLQDQATYVLEMEQQQTGNNALRAQLEQEKQQLQQELEQSSKQLVSNKQEIQKLKSSRKQSSVLNLEIEAAEKSLSEASAKLSLRNSEVQTLSEQLRSTTDCQERMRKEIELLEAAKAAECTHSQQLKQQIDQLQRQIKDAIHAKELALDAGKELETARELLQQQLEQLRLQLAGVAGQHEAALAEVRNSKDHVQQQLLQLQQRQHVTQEELRTAERALEDLRIEHLDYKIKAQAVLRKNQHKDSAQEREQYEELLALRASEQLFQTQAKRYTHQLAEHERELEQLREENASLQRRGKEQLQLIYELKQQNEQMAQENRQQLQQQQESYKQHRLQIETLDVCHKQQLQELETSCARKLEQLNVEHSKAVAVRQPPVVGASKAYESPLSLQMQQSKIEFLLMEREDAEGSEEAAAEALANIAASRKISTASRRSHDFMPLDELLNAPMIVSDTVTTITSHSLGRNSDDSSSSQLELQATKERLHKQESHVRHLTTLLAENEQDLAKLTQMNDMLKEELRRQERGVEREKHMHNSEYLKNVVVKFLTLNSGDEKTRLVPVLNTILKLSRTESEMLTCAAKGQKVSTDGNNRGWGNFLPTWGNNN